jgi:hypothetical protein
MFSQTPIFIRELTEHKAITTHIVAAFMLANLFALLYLIINAIKPIPYALDDISVESSCPVSSFRFFTFFRDYFAMTTVFGVSIACSIACAFFWDKAVVIDGTRVRYGFFSAPPFRLLSLIQFSREKFTDFSSCIHCWSCWKHIRDDLLRLCVVLP